VELVDGDYTCEISGDVFSVANGVLIGPMLSGRSVAVLRHGAQAPNREFVFSAYPGASETIVFSDETGISVMLIAHNAANQEYAISLGGVEIVPATPFTHGERIVIGQGATMYDEFTLTITSTDGAATFVYKKGPPPEANRIRVEYVRSAEGAWETGVNIWAWNPGDIFSEGWPGRPMTREGDAWVFYFEPGLNVPITLMFNNQGPGGAGGEQTSYATITRSSRVYQTNGNSIGDVTPLD